MTSTLAAPVEPPVRLTAMVFRMVPLKGSVCEYVAALNASVPGIGGRSMIVTTAVLCAPIATPAVAFCNARLMVSSPSVSASAFTVMLKLFAAESPSAQFSVTGEAGTVKSSSTVADPPVTMTSTLAAPVETPVRLTAMVFRMVPLAGSVCEYVAALNVSALGGTTSAHV